MEDKAAATVAVEVAVVAAAEAVTMEATEAAEAVLDLMSAVDHL